MTIILMGPSGSGKSTLGGALAAATGWPFIDADDLHPPANVEKMRQGIPLTDDDRAPWLARVRAAIARTVQQESHVLVACSALRDRYRHALADGMSEVRWVLLAASPEELQRRLERRTGHFAGPSILAGQLRTLEEPHEALIVGTERPVDEIMRDICVQLRLPCLPQGDTRFRTS
jgi:gluconokinase